MSMTSKANSPFTSHYDKHYNAYWVGLEPMIFHCHHYNLFLQNTIKDAGELFDVDTLLSQSAEYVVYHQWVNLFGPPGENKISVATLLEGFSLFGFGKLTLKDNSIEGGKIVSDYEHYSVGYTLKYPIPSMDKEGVSYFAKGFIAALFSYIYNQPLFSYKVTQTKCKSKGDDIIAFEVIRLSKPAQPAYNYYAGKGILGEPYEYTNPQNTTVDYIGIREALTQMVLVGDSETGLIDAFGVLLTRHYANYYCNISYGLLQEMYNQLGNKGIELVKNLLIEAGHVCAFHTFGSIMTSMEWEALIKPMLKTREDWVHGIIACVNALGWGTWIIRELVPYLFLTIEIFNDYESNHYLACKHYNYRVPIAYLAVGGTAGIMNLIYNADITSKPTLTEEFYQKAFKSEKRFVATQINCIFLGDKSAVIKAELQHA